MEKREYYDHIQRDKNDPEGERVVELLNLASNREFGEIAVYRPLSRTYVYTQGMWDWKSRSEFDERYRLVTDEARIRELDAIKAELYPDTV